MNEKGFSFMPSMNHLEGNIVKIAKDYFIESFPKGYFKTIKVASEIPAMERANFKKSVHAYQKPMLVIKSKWGGPSEDSEYRPNELEQYMNPLPDKNGKRAINMNSAYNVLNRKKYNIFGTIRRYIIGIEFYIYTDSEGAQNNLLNTLDSRIPHGVEHTLHANVLHHVPPSIMYNIAILETDGEKREVDKDLLSDLNDNITSPITEIFRGGSGKKEHFILSDEPILVKYDQTPSTDSRTIGRIGTDYAVIENCRYEVSSLSQYYISPREEIEVTEQDYTDFEDSNKIVYTGIYLGPPPNEKNDKELYLNFEFSLDDANDNKLNLIDLFEGFVDSDLYVTMEHYKDKTGDDAVDLFDIEVIKDGKDSVNTSFNDYVVTINDPVDVSASYNFRMYVDVSIVQEYIASIRGVYNE